MATIRQKKEVPGTEDEFLPLAVRTLVINGKRLTPAFYKQILEEDLIGESTADLRGILGYSHLHTKECPALPHKHVLWGLETKLCLATIVARKDDSRYQRQESLSTKKQQQYISLLALALALAGHSPTIEWMAEDRRKILIDGYTLYSSSAVADRLESLEKAHKQYKEDETLFHTNHSQDEAETLLKQLSSLGLEIVHPLREEVKGDIFSRYYGDSGWRTCPAKVERKEALLYWGVKEHWKREQLETGLREQLEANLASPSEASSLRYLLASCMMHAQDGQRVYRGSSSCTQKRDQEISTTLHG